MSDRAQWRLEQPPGGLGRPWPTLVEMCGVLPPSSFTVIGGFMVRLHAVRSGIDRARPTTDIDVVLHIETGATTFAAARAALEGNGYGLRTALHPDAVEHRFVRGEHAIDLLVADHVAPAVLRARARGRVVHAPGATRALRHTVDVRIEHDGSDVTFSMPDEFGALAIKAAAFTADAVRGSRHLDDIHVLLAAQREPLLVLDAANASSIETRRRVSGALDAARSHPSVLGRDDRARVDQLLGLWEADLMGEGDRRRERRR